MIDENVKVRVCGENLEFHTALCAGFTEDNLPITFYSGVSDLDEIHNALYLINRTVIRTMQREFNVALDQMDDFFLSAISEAFTKEQNRMASEEPKKITFRTISKSRGFDQK